MLADLVPRIPSPSQTIIHEDCLKMTRDEDPTPQHAHTQYMCSTLYTTPMHTMGRVD